MRQWTDPAAAVLGVQSYGPFGEPRDPVGTPPWGFTGEWHDPAGMVYLRARWYNPALGRFTQVDPVPGVAGAPATLHRYAYVLDDPLNNTDPSGEVGLLPALGISVGVGALAGAIGGGVSYVIAHPGHSLGEYVRDPGFQRSVGSGAVGGAVAGLAIFALPTPTTFLGAVGVGALSGALGGGASRVTENVLTPCAGWYEGVPEAMLVGGISGGATAGLFYGASQWLRGSTLQRQLQAIADTVDRSIPGRGPLAGTLKHTAFEREVRALGRPLVRTEVSYLRGEEVARGRPGSIRVDVVEEVVDRAGRRIIRAVFDLKTGAAELTARRIAQIQAHLPSPAPVIQIKPR